MNNDVVFVCRFVKPNEPLRPKGLSGSDQQWRGVATFLHCDWSVMREKSRGDLGSHRSMNPFREKLVSAKSRSYSQTRVC